MGAAFLITLREGLEAALIISIILAYLNSVNRRDQHRPVWLGALGAVAVSLAAGAVIFLVSGGLSHTASEIFEGVATLTAVVVLTWMVFWMRRNARNLKGELQEKVDVALASRSALTLGVLAFVVVVREGLETALFLFSAFKAGGETPGILTFSGAVLGLAVAIGLGMVIYRGGSRLNIRTFFRVTAVLILFVAASLLVYGIHELLEVGAFRFLDGTGLLAGAPIVSVPLSIINRALLGLGGTPTWLEFGAWAAYLLIVGYLFFRPSREAQRPIPAPQPQENARA